MTPDEQWVTGVMAGLAAVPVVLFLFGMLKVEVAEGQALVVTRFGKLARTIAKPGLHWLIDRVMPWVELRRVSLRRDFRKIEGIRVNDARGTTLIVDAWVELHVVQPERALFAVTDWEAALKNLVSHSIISMLSTKEFADILRSRTEIGEHVCADIAAETERWGIEIDEIFVMEIKLLPDVERQMNQVIAARLERATADTVEEGRQRVAMLEAETSAAIAALIAEAKSQYPAAMSRAYAKLADKPAVRTAYDELYRLSIIQPHRTVAFWGFSGSELRAADAAMLLGDVPSEVRAPLTEE